MLQKTLQSQIMNQVNDFPLLVGILLNMANGAESPQRNLPLWALLSPYNSCKDD